MAALPAALDGERVYGGFWMRLVAWLLDGLLLAPVVFLLYALGSGTTMVVASVATYVVVWGYAVALTARWGCTLGKAALGLRVVNVDGSRVGWAGALRRYAVFLALGLLALTVDGGGNNAVDLTGPPEGIIDVSSATADDSSLPWSAALPFAYLVAFWVWLVIDLVCLLASKRKRAAHDVIGGTVVVRRSVAEQARRAVRPEA